VDTAFSISIIIIQKVKKQAWVIIMLWLYYVFLIIIIIIIIQKKLTNKYTKNLGIFKFSSRVGTIVARSKKVQKQAGVVHNIKSK